MLRFVFTALGVALLAVGFALLVLDGTRSLAGSTLAYSSLGEAIEWAAPDRLAALRRLIEGNVHPLLWDPVLTTILRAPAGLVCFVLGAFVAWRAGRRAPEIGIVSR